MAEAGMDTSTIARRRWTSIGNVVAAKKEFRESQSLLVSQDTEEDPAKFIKVAVLLPGEPENLKTLISAVAQDLNIEPSYLSLKNLKANITEDVSLFGNADLLIVDISNSEDRPFLSFQLGLRESAGKRENIVLFEDVNDESTIRLSTDRYSCAPFKCRDGGVIWNTKEDVNMIHYLDTTILAVLEGLPVCSTKEKMFMEGLKRARNPDSSVDDRVGVLAQLEKLLQRNPRMITSQHLLDLMLTYCDLGQYEKMIHLVNVAGRHSEVTQAPQIQYFVAFALNRRNAAGDRNRALKIIDGVCIQLGDGAGDAWGLKGRIYKDKFIESIDAGGRIDYSSCEQAIDAYRQAFKIEGSLYGGVNLVTLLYASEKYKERKQEIENICSKLNGDIARKGGVQRITDYWEVASFFEINAVGGLFSLSNQAAHIMFSLATQKWMIETTMRNVVLIDKLRKKRDALAAGISMDEAAHDVTKDPGRHEFEFYCEFFLISTRSTSSSVRFPALLQTVGSPRPMHITVHPETNRDEATIEVIELNGTERKYSMMAISSIKYVNTPFQTDIEMTDKRRVCIAGSSARGFFTFTISFPTEEVRDRFYALCEEGGYITHNDEGSADVEDEKIDWEFELVDGKRKLLGRGANADVYAAIDTRTSEDIAVKEVIVGESAGNVTDLKEEIRTIKHLQHSNIIKFLGVDQKPGIFRLLMEMVPGGSVTDMLYMYGPLSDNKFLRNYTLQILEALAYLHGSDIIHRDVKGDNVLVNMYNGVLKMADFGTSKRMAGLNPRTDTLAGTPWYMAPEVIQSDTHDYGREADVWSFGCTVWQMATGKPPLVEMRDPNEVMEAIGIYQEHEEISDEWEEDLKDFLNKCFTIDPKERFTTDQLLQHSFLAVIESDESPQFDRKNSNLSTSERRKSGDGATLTRRTSLQVSPTLTRATSLTRSISREYSQGGSPIDAWTYPQRHREVCSLVHDNLIATRTQLADAWLALMKEDPTMECSQDSEARIQALFDVFVSQIKDEKAAQTPTSVLTSKLRAIIPPSELHQMNLSPSTTALTLQKLLLCLKPQEKYKPSFLLPFLRNPGEGMIGINPHSVFDVVSIIETAVQTVMESLSSVTQCSKKGQERKRHLETGRQRARARSNPPVVQKRVGGTTTLNESMTNDESMDLGYLVNELTLARQSMHQIMRGESTHSLGGLRPEVIIEPCEIDEELKEFLADLDLHPSIANALHRQQVTLNILLDHFDKDDLKDVGLPIGPRCVLWKAVLRERAQR